MTDTGRPYSSSFLTRRYRSNELIEVDVGSRFGASFVDCVLLLLVIPFLVWLAITAPRGQSPGKSLFGIYTLDSNGTRLSAGAVWLRELVAKWLVIIVLGFVTLGVYPVLAAVWCLWDKDHQTLWDKMVGTFVCKSPVGFVPPAASELRQYGWAPIVPELQRRTAEMEELFAASLR